RRFAEAFLAQRFCEASLKGTAYSRRLKRCHVAHDVRRTLNKVERKYRAAALAEPQAEIQKRIQIERFEHRPVTRFDAAMAGDEIRSPIRIDARRDQARHRADKAIENDDQPPRGGLQG